MFNCQVDLVGQVGQVGQVGLMNKVDMLLHVGQEGQEGQVFRPNHLSLVAQVSQSLVSLSLLLIRGVLSDQSFQDCLVDPVLLVSHSDQLVQQGRFFHFQVVLVVLFLHSFLLVQDYLSVREDHWIPSPLGFLLLDSLSVLVSLVDLACQVTLGILKNKVR